jgi:hypothetical protein
MRTYWDFSSESIINDPERKNYGLTILALFSLLTKRGGVMAVVKKTITITAA